MTDRSTTSDGRGEHKGACALRDRLSAIAKRDLADRTLTPGEALDLVKLYDAAWSLHAGLTCAQDPMDVDERVTLLGDVLEGLNG